MSAFMALKRVKIGKEFYSIPAVKTGKGWLRLEKGKTANVSFERSRKQILLTVKTGETYAGTKRQKTTREFFRIEEYELANRRARAANIQGEQAGARFGAIRKDEEAALKIWREYLLRKTLAGETPADLAEIVKSGIEREETKDNTPQFPQVADAFLEYKEKSGVWKGGDSAEIAASRLKRLARALIDENENPLTLAEITPEVLETAIPAAIERKKNGVPAPQTLNHYEKLMKEIFSWWYARENHARPAKDQLKNPLALFVPRKAVFLEEPEVLTVPAARALLADLWKHEKKALPAVLVQMFCGLRNAEAFRVKWKDFRRDGNETFLYLSKAITKTSVSRSVPVSANLSAWLAALAASGIPQDAESYLYPAASERTRKKGVNLALERAQKRAGISKPANAFRHTAVSAFCVLFDVFKAASYCGHNVRIQGEFYRAAMSKKDAQEYFAIFPPPPAPLADGGQAPNPPAQG